MMKHHLESSAAQRNLLIEQWFRKLRRWLPGLNAARRSEVARDLETLRRVSTCITLYALTCIMQHLSNAVSSRRRSLPCRRRCQQFDKAASLQSYASHVEWVHKHNVKENPLAAYLPRGRVNPLECMNLLKLSCLHSMHCTAAWFIESATYIL